MFHSFNRSAKVRINARNDEDGCGLPPFPYFCCMQQLHNKFVLITGASSGIGRACAEEFATYGCHLLLTGRRKERLDDLKAKILSKYSVEVHVFCFDVRKKDEVIAFSNQLIEKQITPDILINNAGLAVGRTKIQDGIFDDWERMIDTNVKGLLYITRCILPLMIEKNAGHIINIGSTAGHIIYPAGNVYNASKFAVKALNEAINLDLVDTNIRVCSIDPGAVETEFSLVRFKGNEEVAGQVYEGYQPLSPKDIAEIAVFVVSRPKHVNILSMVVYPTAQRSVYVHRKEA